MGVVRFHRVVVAAAVALCSCDETVTGPGPMTTGSGSSGSGGEGTFVCVPGTAEACYSGPSGTEGVGPCAAGTRLCRDDGSGFGPCDGEVTPRQESCETAEDDNCDSLPPAVCPGPLECGNVFGGEAADDARSLAIDAEGGFAIGGRIRGAVDFGGAPIGLPDGSGYLARYRADGTHAFSRAFPLALESYVPQVAVGPADEVLLATTFQETIDLGGGTLTSCSGNADYNVAAAALGPSGEHLWSRTIGWSPRPCGGAGPRAMAIANAGAGSVVGGEIQYKADFGAGEHAAPAMFEGFVAHLNQLGELENLMTLGGPGDSHVFAADVDGAGNLVFAGLAADVDLLGPIDYAFVAKVDATGRVVWAADAGAWPYSVAADGDLNVLVAITCGFETGCTVLGTPIAGSNALLRFDATGALQWLRGLGDGWAATIDVDAAGNVVAAGSLHSVTVDFGTGPVEPTGDGPLGFVVIYDAAGEHVWSQLLPGTEPGAVAFDPSGDVIVTGSAIGTVDFGCGPVTSAGDEDVFVVKLDVP